MIPRNIAITIVVLLAGLAAMGLYGWHLQRQAAELSKNAVDTKPVAPPVNGPAGHITVFIPNDDRGDLVRRDVVAALPTEPTLRAREVVHALIEQWQEKDSTHRIAANADVREVFLLDQNKIAVVDVNSAFADEHRSGVMVEELSLAAIARTLGANIGTIKEVKVIVDGRERETLAGHADLTEFYPTDLAWQVE